MMKKFVFLLLTALSPLGILALTEAVLLLAGQGYTTGPMTEVPELPDVLVQNPEFIKKYYSPSSLVPLDEQGSVLVSRQKSPGTLRGFVVGESTPQGFPFFLNHSFSNVAAAAWNQDLRENPLEVINFGRSAMSSFYLKDAARKLQEYKPDFLVVYAGHNEYLGTLSAFTGLFPDLNLALKEYRVGQVLLDALAAGPVKGKTLMASRFDAFDGVRFTPEQDALVVKVFLRNLESALLPYLESGTPVFLFEPVSNYLDMPPFRSEGEKAQEQKIRQIVSLLNRNRTEEAAALLNSAGFTKDSALGLFLTAQTERITTGKPDLEKFKKASDLDLVPFRAKSLLVEELQKWAEETARVHPALKYIPTARLLEEEFGPEGFSNLLFIDHLHFNWKGQRVMARYLLDAMSRQWPQPEPRNYKAVLESPERINKLTGMTPPLEYQALVRVKDLVSQEPYSSMMLGYPIIDPESAFEGAGEQDQLLLKHLNEGNKDNFISSLLEFYRTGKPGTGMHRDLEALAILFPARWQAQWMYGQLMLRLGVYDKALGPLSRAFFLSGRNKQISEDLKSLARESGNPELLEYFNLDR